MAGKAYAAVFPRNSNQESNKIERTGRVRESSSHRQRSFTENSAKLLLVTFSKLAVFHGPGTPLFFSNAAYAEKKSNEEVSAGRGRRAGPR
jgi:hypothetical protein